MFNQVVVIPLAQSVRYVTSPLFPVEESEMRERGFSLVELLTAIVIVSVLVVIAALGFTEYMRRDKKQNQTRMIHAEIMQARLHSLTERRGRVAKISRTSFEVYSSAVDDEQGAAPQLKLALQYPVEWNGTGRSIEIDDRGVVTSGWRSICLEDVTDKALLDSVVVRNTRVSLGMRKEGATCAGDWITVK